MSRRMLSGMGGRKSQPTTKTHTPHEPPPADQGSQWEQLDLDMIVEGIDSADLRDFLAADLLKTKADPIFKERLREKLWNLVRTRSGSDDSLG